MTESSAFEKAVRKAREDLHGFTEAFERAMEIRKAEHLLADVGVFAGHNGLRGLAECDEFWRRMPYGTRLYYDGGAYLHRDVLRAAVRVLDAVASCQVEGENDGR